MVEIRNEDEFWVWQAANPHGYFVNPAKNGKRVLHRADCYHYPANNMKAPLRLPKFVSASREDLAAAASPTDDCDCLDR